MTDAEITPPQEEEEKYELTPEEATSLDDIKPIVINRKRILITISIFLSILIGGSIIFNAFKKDKQKTLTEEELQAANSSADFIDSLQTRALRNRESDPIPVTPEKEQLAEAEKEPLLPQASINSREVDSVRPQQTQPPPPSSSYGGSGGGGSSQPQQATHFKSPLVPAIEGRLFASQPQYTQPTTAANTQQRSAAEEYFNSAAANASRSNPYGGGVSDYNAQNDQQNKQSFYGSNGNSSSGAITGFFLGENTIWTGTIIPGILETAINTDLPGNIVARVSQNVYDSQTGQKLLIPQGTLLLARYNSSVSYAQHRVQIVWDAMIRPDGLQINLEGANGVDKAGMSGQAAQYHENWFEYLKAAGIISLFSIANAKMTEAAAQNSTPDTAGNIAAANSAFVNKVGDNLISRAMNIQPTLIVEGGTPINIMLNKTIYLPPVPPVPPTQKYILEKSYEKF